MATSKVGEDPGMDIHKPVTEIETDIVTQPSDGSRLRTHTDKGLSYKRENTEKSLHNVFRQLKTKSEQMKQMMEKDTDLGVMKQQHEEWMSLFEKFFSVFDELCSLISAEDRQVFAEKHFFGMDTYLKGFKTSIENWFLEKQAHPGKSSVVEETVKPADSVSQLGKASARRSQVSYHSRLSSSVSAARLLEEQKQLELSAKSAMLKQKQELEMAQLKIKMQQEKLEIDTQLAVSDAKRKLLEKFETSSNVSKCNVFPNVVTQAVTPAVNDTKSLLNSCISSTTPDQVISEVVHNVQVDKPKPVCTDKVSCSGLNPSADMFTPRHSKHISCMKNGMSSTFNVDNTGNNDGNVRANDMNANMNAYMMPCDNNAFSGTNPVSFQNPLVSVVQHLRKPLADLKKFSGDPMDYKKFIRQFNSRVVVNTESDEERMNFLEQFTTGEANRIVSGFSYLDAEQGYHVALKEIEERYGNKEILANAFVKKALNWPSVKPDNAKGLDDFAIFLTECENAIAGIESVRVLEYAENMKQIIGKLPYHCHDRWRSIVQQVKSRNETINFSHLVSFVKTEAKKANDPTYGRDAMKDHSKIQTSGDRKVRQRSSFATTEISHVPTNELDQKCKADSLDTKITTFGDSSSSRGTAFVSPCLHCNSSAHALENCNVLAKSTFGEKMSVLKNKGICFGCLRRGHLRSDCKRKATCDRCQGRHPTVLHSDDFKRKTSGPDGKQTPSDLRVSPSNALSLHTMDVDDCTMAIVPVKVKMKNGAKVVETYAFMDPGSSVSFCTEDLMREVGGNGRRVKITLDTIGTPHTMYTHAVQGLEICDLNMNNVIRLPRVYTKDEMPVRRVHIPTEEDVSQWAHLNHLKLPQIEAGITLLIGNNVPDAYAPLDVLTGPSGAPHATRTRLGWILWNVVRHANRIQTDDETARHSVNRIHVSSIHRIEEAEKLETLVREAINLDFPERLCDEKKENSEEDKRFLRSIDSSITKVNGHYQINLPFKDGNSMLPNNHIQVKQRLKGVKKKMEKCPKFNEDYCDFMEKLLEKGYAEPVPEEDLNRCDGKVWYIPHHGVYHPRKPHKIRVVFDCTAAYEGVSLNSLLLQGPDLTSNLLGVLLRFRQEKYAIMGDIESMFYQVHVPKSDCDYLRFYWWPDGNLDQTPAEYRMTVHLFGAVSSPSCANAALRQTAKANKGCFHQDVTDTVMNNFYMDDCLTSVPTEEEASALINNVSALCQEGGFHLTKWMSNSHHVLATVPREERATEVKSMDLGNDTLPCERDLGVFWNAEFDTLGFKISLRTVNPTRRSILSVVSAVYDPLGFASPFVLTAKQLLQDLCRQKIGWDDDLNNCDKMKWEKWIIDLPLLETVQTSRCYKPHDFGVVKSCQLHNFSDASDLGYGMASYLRLIDDTGNIHCAFLIGKSRVAPLKKTTIPRMELTAAVMAVRINNMLLKELDIKPDQVMFWTDSTSVLWYIVNETARFKTFVANRVAVIKDSTDRRQWRYIDTKANPADCASRGMHMNRFIETKCWLNGPEFLWSPEITWPKNDIPQISMDAEAEVKHQTYATLTADSSETMDKLLHHFSDWKKLKKTVAWLLLARENLRAWVLERRRLKSISVKGILADGQTVADKVKMLQLARANDCKEKVQSVKISTEQLQEAERSLIKFVQQTYFSEELQSLRGSEGSCAVSKQSKIVKLDPIIKDDVLRVGGRLRHSSISDEAKHPVILPRDSALSRLLIQHAHRNVGHLGKSSTLALLREKYWIVGAPSAIKSLLSRCVLCRKLRAHKGEQKMADLPEERLQPDDPPFTRCGLDYFGPISVKRGRSTVKRYGVIFTCLATRAVHLELAFSLDTDSCINAIRRFIARRGPVKYLRSDNGTNFVGSNRELKEMIQKLNQSRIHNSLLQKGITWVFNPPASSHFGGVWERLIRSVRRILQGLLNEQVIRFDDEGLQTLLCEVESVLNGRPITTISNDPNDLNALTPNHLLLMRSGETFPPGLFNKKNVYAKRRWHQMQYLADVFWKRWTREYLPLLQQRQKWHRPKKNLAVGDIALIVENSPRNSWAMGIILETYPDSKGQVRVVKLKTKSGELVRPVHKLCVVLEAD